MSEAYSHYEITVITPAGFLFSTSPRSATDSEKMRWLVALFQKKFPASEGYRLNVVGWNYYGTEVPIE